MNFMDAIKTMQTSKRLTRPSWIDYYIAIIPGQTYIWKIGNTNQSHQPNVTEYVPSLADIAATDWMVKTN